MTRTSQHHFVTKTLWAMASSGLICLSIMGLGYYYLHKQLPNVEALKDVHLQVPLRIYSQDGHLMAEYGKKRRIPVTLSSVPTPLIHAFLAAEDQRFYEHAGIDVLSLARATLSLLKTGKKSQGASTITMQVARNFFLTRKKTYMRKLNEILLAIKIDQELSKEKILELYLNKIYLGQSAYGVAAAAKIYYGKSLPELTLAQMAMIAALPKAPSRVNPVNNPEQARQRRNYVLSRMLEEGFIDNATYNVTITTPITASRHRQQATLQAPYVAEMVRQLLYEHFGEDAYSRGLSVYTTIDSQQQQAANHALRQGLLAYDRRHGYRGPKTKADPEGQWQSLITYSPMQIAKVTGFDDLVTHAELMDGQTIEIPWVELKWARQAQDNGRRGPPLKTPEDALTIDDVIEVEYDKTQQVWQLRQSPEIEGALVAMDAQNGALKAVVGGYHYLHSKYNRATQAERQPGSSFKPFIYAAALGKGYTLATIFNDAPIVKRDASLENEYWRPKNHTREFQGPTRLRTGLTRSRNLVSIRLLERIGIGYAIDYLAQFGFDKSSMPRSLTLALGTPAMTPLALTQGFAVLANGGFAVTPHIIDKITDTQSQVILQNKAPQACYRCRFDSKITPPDNMAPHVIDAQVAYLINTALKDPLLKGPAPVRGLGRRDIAGKTGSTNDHFDAWFVGYNGNLVATTWVGYDNPHIMYEYGIKAARPIGIAFLKEALAGQPEYSIPEPPGMIRLRIDPLTGLLAKSDQKKSFLEIFRREYAPTQSSYRNDTPTDNAKKTLSTPEESEYLF